MENKTKLKDKVQIVLQALLNNWARVILLILLCTVIVKLVQDWHSLFHWIGSLLGVLAPFIIGILLTLILSQPVRSCSNLIQNKILNRFDKLSKEKKVKISHRLGIFIVYAILFILIAFLMGYVIPEVSKSFSDLFSTVSTFYKKIVYHKEEAKTEYPYLPVEWIWTLLTKVVPSKIMSSYNEALQVIFPYVFSISSSVVNVILDLFLGIMISIYLLGDIKVIAHKMYQATILLGGDRRGKLIWKTILGCKKIFVGFIFGKSIDSLIIGILCFIVMSILQLPYAILLSVIVGVTNMIPYFGPFIGAVPGVVIYLVVNPKAAIIFVIMLFVLQQFDGMILGPKILGDQTGIKPIFVILGITIGGAYFGVLGMFLGVPIVAMIVYITKMIYENKVRRYMQKNVKETGKGVQLMPKELEEN